jgi:hypothetical protein
MGTKVALWVMQIGLWGVFIWQAISSGINHDWQKMALCIILLPVISVLIHIFRNIINVMD